MHLIFFVAKVMNKKLKKKKLYENYYTQWLAAAQSEQLPGMPLWGFAIYMNFSI